MANAPLPMWHLVTLSRSLHLHVVFEWPLMVLVVHSLTLCYCNWISNLGALVWSSRERSSVRNHHQRRQCSQDFFHVSQFWGVCCERVSNFRTLSPRPHRRSRGWQHQTVTTFEQWKRKPLVQTRMSNTKIPVTTNPVCRNSFSCRPKCVEANEGIILELSLHVLQSVASIIIPGIRHRRQNEPEHHVGTCIRYESLLKLNSLFSIFRKLN